MRPGSIQVCGGRLESAWWGPGPAEAPTLVLLHEGLGSITLWRDVPELLAACTGWGVFAYSRAGYGDSDPAPLPLPMTYMHQQAQVLPEVLHAADIHQAVLIGHSDGGSIAAIYAGSHPRRSFVQHSSAAPPPGFAASPAIAGTQHDPVRLLGLVTIAAHFMVEDLNLDSIRRIKSEYESGSLRQRLARYHRNVDTAFRGWNDAWLDPRFKDFDITAMLPHIGVPILGLQGTADPYGTELQLEILNANVTAPITTQLIAGARHSPHLEAKDATLTAISAFIASLPRDPLT